MIRERNTTHPNFLLGIAGYILLLVGVVVLATLGTGGKVLIGTAFGAIGVHWIRSLVDVWTDTELKGDESRYFWLAIVIMVPPLAGMLYYLVEDRKFQT